MAKHRSRAIQIPIRVNEREKALIDRKMELAGIRNMNTYMRKMAIEGYVINLDMSDIKELVVLLRRVGANVNQIAKRVNETRHIYAEDVEDLKKGQVTIWNQVDALLKIWNKL